jgi:hypothetical protein
MNYPINGKNIKVCVIVNPENSINISRRVRTRKKDTSRI